MLNQSLVEINQIPEEAGYVIFLVNKEMVVQKTNKLFAKLYKLTPEDVVGKTLYELYPGFDRSVFNDALKKTISTGQSVTRLGYSNNTGKILSARALKYEDNFLVIAHEIDNTLKFGYISHYDNLTSIRNRYALEDDLDKNFVDKKEFTLLLVDILNFKSINDSFGVTQGDLILMEFAARLKRLLGNTINSYRYNADQFAILIQSIDVVDINQILQNIQDVKKEPFIAQSNQIIFDLAIGYSMVNKFEQSFQDIITNTEMALTKAKKTKNKSAIMYNESEYLLDNKNKVVLANELRKALKENTGLVLYYQRQIDCRDKKVCGAEALIRWEHPTRGFISPAQFLPVAEEFDLMFELDKFVFLRAVREIYDLMKEKIELPISINLSSSSLCNPKIVEIIEKVLKRIPINPELITIEITESAFIEDKQISKDIVNQIKKLGMNIALDDFCTGYSSMEYLLSYPADYLKIDREFIKGINKDVQRQNIVKGLITMAQSLNMAVIAEGVEIVEEANLLVKMNCNMIQGYFFGRPEKYEDLITLIKNKGYSKSKGKVRYSDNTSICIQ